MKSKSYMDLLFGDWSAKIHDGEDASARIVGRYCGDQTFPSGYFLTTHHQLFLWFRSDHSVAGQGFELVWNTTDPGDIYNYRRKWLCYGFA